VLLGVGEISVFDYVFMWLSVGDVYVVLCCSVTECGNDFPFGDNKGILFYSIHGNNRPELKLEDDKRPETRSRKWGLMLY